MKIPQLKKKLELKSCHNITWEDNYSWVHQDNILEVLRDSSKLLPDVRKYLEDENKYIENNLKEKKEFQKKLFEEIKSRIKLDDESLPFKDKEFEYWTKTTTKGNYSIKLRRKIGSQEIEEFWNGDKEKEKLKTEYFGVGDLEVSNDKYLAYSLDLKGSEYFTIYVRDIVSKKLVSEKLKKQVEVSFLAWMTIFYFIQNLMSSIDQEKIFMHQLGQVLKMMCLFLKKKMMLLLLE